jgi:Fe-S oxidoreductase
MPRTKQYAYCCGGGGGNFFSDTIGSSEERAPARIRVREAAETGAKVLAVACPICAVMFEDAIKSEDLEGKLSVKSIDELVRESLV